MNNIYFEYPYILFFIPIILLLLFYFPKKEDSLIFSNIQNISYANKSLSLVSLLKALTFVFLLLALASPCEKTKYKKIKKDSISIVLAVDLSTSMQDKFKSVKKIIKKFLKERVDSKIGIVFFADDATIASPLTFDISFINKLFDSIKIGDLGYTNTALNDAIILSAKLLSIQRTKSKVLLMLTDGIEKGSKNSYNDTKNFLIDKKFDFITIGFGEDIDKEYIKSFNSKLILAKDTKSLKKAFLKVDKMYKTKEKAKSHMLINYYYQLPLFFAFLTLLFYTYLINKRSIL